MGAILRITVSRENVELHRALNAAFNANDIDAWIGLSDPDIEFETRFAPLTGETTYRGHDGIRSFRRSLEEVWGDDIGVEAEQYFDLGERTLAFYRLRGRGQQSGAEVAIEATVVATWHGGLCVHWKSYADRKGALRELGVTEGELEPIAP
jgi:ketosteroid isomerase-like protein